MCGRFSLELTNMSEVGARFAVAQNAVDAWQARYNIAPSQLAPVVLARAERRLELLEWGLISPWSGAGGRGNRPINARVETAATLPTFRDALRLRRCVVPATGYYEWRAGSDGRKQPHWISDADGELLAFAGLWSSSGSQEGSRDTFAILTTAALGPVAQVHDRMPLLLPLKHLDAWLTPRLPFDAQLLRELATSPMLAEQLLVRPVSRLVNAPANDGPECLLPAPEEPADRQLGLFGDG